MMIDIIILALIVLGQIFEDFIYWLEWAYQIRSIRGTIADN